MFLFQPGVEKERRSFSAHQKCYIYITTPAAAEYGILSLQQRKQNKMLHARTARSRWSIAPPPKKRGNSRYCFHDIGVGHATVGKIFLLLAARASDRCCAVAASHALE